MLSESVLKRLVLSRYFFELALQNVRSEQEVADSACVNLLQDSIEIFFLAAFDVLNVATAGRTDFPQYLDKLSEAVGYDLPYRRRLLEINRVRVHTKHEGIPPNRKEIDGYVTDARKFLEEVCLKVLEVDYWTVSLIALVDEGPVKELLKKAEEAFKAGEFLDCLIECRKAFFVTFESNYDTQKDLTAATAFFGSSAPYYAKDKEYIKKNVKTPFDYIVLDHKNLDAELMKEGIDNTAFWNVWRLTPEVYRFKDEDDWLVKRHPAKEVVEGINERAGYVLSSIISILLARQSSRRMMKSLAGQRFELKVKSPGLNVYEKADKAGPIAGKLPDDVEKIDVEFSTRGLNDEEIYWNVFYFQKNPFLILSGYMLEDELIFE